MIFKTIKLKNFRQYKGLHSYDFSQPGDGNITLLIAENGVGKTTFIQAFRFCFYGNLNNNKYLNLPKPDELLNDTIVYDLEDNETAEAYVEITFDHKGTNYVMHRKIEYIKQNNKMIQIANNSTLSYATGVDGYRTLEGTEADLEMNKILPAGLSHIFMFDGERMEREVGSKEFKSELKESILGILNIKKYDALIQHLGDTNKKTSVIGRVYGQITHTDLETDVEKKRYDDLKDRLEAEKNGLLRTEEEIIEVEREQEKYRSIQKEIDLDREKLATIEAIDLKVKNLEKDKNQIIDELISLGLKLLLYKELLAVKAPFDSFVEDALDTENFFQYLHINTLEEILEKKQCLCGTAVLPGSYEEELIERLKKSALPEANAQNISFIQSDIFSRASDYADKVEKMKHRKSELDRINAEIQKELADHRKLSYEIKENEERYGENLQVKVEELQSKRDALIERKAKSENDIMYLERLYRQQEAKVLPMLEKNKKNSLISKAVKDLRVIRDELVKQQEEMEEKARKVLSKYFNEEISTVMSGNYDTEILPDFSIRIVDKDKQVEVTEVLSTGQNVIISVSFIKSLISTAKELSLSYDSESQYGVIMDAALSNLDERHIQKISENNLTQLDQLIFLSFKRQLRDEMFASIEEHVGKAYSLRKEKEQIVSKELDSKQLKEYIHRLEGDGNE